MVVATMAVLLGTAEGVSAQGRVPSRTFGVRWEEGVPRVSFSARDLFTRSAVRKLESGLPQTTVMRIYTYVEGRRSPLSVEVRSCRIVYDLWEEVFRIQRQTARADRAFVGRSVADVARRCLRVRGLPLGEAEDYSPRRGRNVYFAVLVELNPMSPDTVQRIRRWLARPGGRRVGSDSFFGSFVSLFVNRRIGDAERAIRFRSQSVEVP